MIKPLKQNQKLSNWKLIKLNKFGWVTVYDMRSMQPCAQQMMFQVKLQTAIEDLKMSFLSPSIPKCSNIFLHIHVFQSIHGSSFPKLFSGKRNSVRSI